MKLFKKKKKPQDLYNPIHETLDCLHNVLEHSEIQDGTVLLATEQLTIRPGVNQVKENYASLYFEVSHPTFEEPFFDMSAGIGNSTAEAIQKAIASFLLSCFCGIRHCVNKEYERELTTTFCDMEKHWDVSESCIATLGNQNEAKHQPQGGYWNLIADKLPNHLGNRKHYWVKVYVSKQQSGEVICECRVNNVVSLELTKELTAFAEKWENNAAINSDKQLFILTQREDTFVPYPYTRDQIFRFTDQAIALFRDADTDDKYDQLAESISNMIGDNSLGMELFCFLPEICAQRAFHDATFGEQIVFQKNDEKYEFYLDQLASYRWIQDQAIQVFSQGKYDNNVFKRMVYSSATCSVLSQALDNGSELKDLVLTSLAFIIPEDYIIR